MSVRVYSLCPSSKKGNENAIKWSQFIVGQVKQCRVHFLDDYFQKHFQPNKQKELQTFIPKECILIPIPRSAPLVIGGQWPSLEICKKLVSYEYGNEIIQALVRVKAVPKSAYQNGADERPSVELHYNTIQKNSKEIIFETTKPIVLVDDIITQGRVSYACYMRVKEIYPNSDIKLFVVARSANSQEIENWNYPKESKLVYFPMSGKTRHDFTEQDDFFNELFGAK